MAFTCEHCHADTRRILIHGSELWCASCVDATRPANDAHAVIGDEIPGGFVQEHFGHEPETFYSKSAMRKRADQLGLQPFVRHVDGDKHLKRWV